MNTIARAVAVVGSLYGLLRNRLGLNVTTPLGAQEISCTVTPDRRLVVLGHDPIAGFARDHGTVANEAAMLALHTLDSTTLIAEPRFVAPGDSCLRADDPGWRWHCISNHGQALSDWERRPLAAALSGLAVSGHTHSMSDVSGLAAALTGKQAAAANLSTLAAAAAPTSAGLALLSVATPEAPRIVQHNADGSITLIPVPSGGSSDMGDMLLIDWRLRVERAGGTLSETSLTLAASLLSSLRTAGVILRLQRLDVWLGSDLRSRLTPLIDRLGGGAIPVGIAAGDVSEASGLTLNGSSYIRTATTPAMLGTSGNGGLGWWEAVATASGGEEPMGSSDNRVGDNRYVLDLRSTLVAFRWGNKSNPSTIATARQAAHYYGQRSAATLRTLYRDGTSIATNTTSDDAYGATVPISIGATNYAGTYYPWTGRCKLAYMTDGKMSAGDITALHSALSDFVAALGR